MPFYKLDKDDLNVWITKVIEFVKEGNIKVYAENALNQITDKIKIYGMPVDDDYIEEIDNPQDLNKVSKEIKIFEKMFNNK